MIITSSTKHYQFEYGFSLLRGEIFRSKLSFVNMQIWPDTSLHHHCCISSMDIQIYWIRMGPPRIPTEAARSRGRTRGFVREQLLAFQLTHNSGVHDWESRASISPWWRAEKCWPCSPVSLLSPPMSLLESWGLVYPGYLGHGGETCFMRKSHGIASELHLLQVFVWLWPF